MSHRASLFVRGYPESHRESPRLRFRRALTLSLLTIVAPGSAQFLMGRKVLGRIALGVWLLSVVALVGVIYVAVTDRARILAVFTDSNKLIAIQVAIVVVAVAWLFLFFDAWRLGISGGMRGHQRAMITVFNSGVTIAVVAATFFAAQLVNAPRSVVENVFTATQTSKPELGRYNILLIGSDSGKERFGLRPDSMTVLSVDSSTGKSALISLPRNLQNVPFPFGSPMYDLFPLGFNCADCLLNAVHTYATNLTAGQYPPGVDPGMAATVGTIEEITGLKINYHILINMKGFNKLVDAVGGITVDVKSRLPIDGVTGPVKGWIEPGVQTLSGYEALWFARSRKGSDDFARMGRQKCVMSAMIQQLSPRTVLLNAQELSESSARMLETNIPASELDMFIDLALKARQSKIVTMAFVPPVIDTSNPDFVKIRELVEETIAKTESGGDIDAPKFDLTPPVDALEIPGTVEVEAKEANVTDDLEATC